MSDITEIEEQAYDNKKCIFFLCKTTYIPFCSHVFHPYGTPQNILKLFLIDCLTFVFTVVTIIS